MKLSHINIRKAPGPDGLPTWVLRDFCDRLSGPVCAIFNASVREGFVPLRWKEAHVIPVPKVHRRCQSIGFATISLTPLLKKILFLSLSLDRESWNGLKIRWTAASIEHIGTAR